MSAPFRSCPEGFLDVQPINSVSLGESQQTLWGGIERTQVADCLLGKSVRGRYVPYYFCFRLFLNVSKRSVLIVLEIDWTRQHHVGQPYLYRRNAAMLSSGGLSIVEFPKSPRAPQSGFRLFLRVTELIGWTSRKVSGQDRNGADTGRRLSPGYLRSWKTRSLLFLLSQIVSKRQ